MRDKAGQVYSTIGGVLVGSGAGALLAGSTNAFAGWIASLGIAVGITTTLGLYMALAALLDWWLPGRRSSLASVIQTAQALSGEIAVWIGERDSFAADVLHEDIVPADDDAAWRRRNARMHMQHYDTMRRWNERFAVKALTAYDLLVAHGARDPGDIDRFAVEHATNSLGIKAVGRTLGVMAAHLQAEKMTRS